MLNAFDSLPPRDAMNRQLAELRAQHSPWYGRVYDPCLTAYELRGRRQKRLELIAGIFTCVCMGIFAAFLFAAWFF